jgi:hypothetical protein
MSLIIDCELTDTFGGEANYSWVHRAEVELPDGATDRAIVRLGKAALGLTGTRCRTFNHGDQWELRPTGSLTVAFLTVRY